MELRSSKALACREERGRAGRAAAKRCAGMGVEVEDMGLGKAVLRFGVVWCFGGGDGLGEGLGGEALGVWEWSGGSGLWRWRLELVGCSGWSM